MPRVLSLDAMIDDEYEREANQEPDDGNWLVQGLQSVPEEDTKHGYYNGRPRDLVDIFNDR